MTTALADLPDLRPQESLDAMLAVRMSSADRARLERAARNLGVPAGRLLRALMRQALAETAPAGRVG